MYLSDDWLCIKYNMERWKKKKACFKNAHGKAQDGEPRAKSVKGKKKKKRHQAYGASKAAWL